MCIRTQLILNSGELKLKLEFIENTIQSEASSIRTWTKLLNFLIYDSSRVKLKF